MKNDVQDAISRPEGSSQFHHGVDGNIVGYKARFVEWGFSQKKKGTNYEETFAATRS